MGRGGFSASPGTRLKRVNVSTYHGSRCTPLGRVRDDDVHEVLVAVGDDDVLDGVRWSFSWPLTPVSRTPTGAPENAIASFGAISDRGTVTGTSERMKNANDDPQSSGSA